jgi:hypothetical protein
MSWSPPHDECTGCRFFKKSRPHPLCAFCGAGEFFEEKSDEVGIDETFLLMDDGSFERRTPKESEIMAEISKDDDDE